MGKSQVQHTKPRATRLGRVVTENKPRAWSPKASRARGHRKQAAVAAIVASPRRKPWVRASIPHQAPCDDVGPRGHRKQAAVAAIVASPRRKPWVRASIPHQAPAGAAGQSSANRSSKATPWRRSNAKYSSSKVLVRAGLLSGFCSSSPSFGRQLPPDSASRRAPFARPSGSGHHGPQRTSTSNSHNMPDKPNQKGGPHSWTAF